MEKENTIMNSSENNIRDPVSLNEKTVLVVEDDRSHRTLMDKILKSFGVQTFQAENGFVALSKVDTGQHFDLIILDLDMPELDGFETAKAIRLREVKEGKPRVPVIAFTAHRKLEDKENCLAAGMDAYLPKDVFLPKWRQTLMDNLQGLIAGNFDLKDFGDQGQDEMQENPQDFDLEAFDEQIFEQSAKLLKDELEIAIEEYLEDAAAYIRDIEAGVEESDPDKAQRGSHPLKSNSKGFGLIAVAEIAEAIHTACMNTEDKDEALQKTAAFAIGKKNLKHALKLRS
ncbi:response regulator [Alphaproteobacteria bacterium]|nr:response regulator [Alphaproteobacteria bacterium]